MPSASLPPSFPSPCRAGIALQIQKNMNQRRRSRSCAIILIVAGLVNLALVAVLLLRPAMPTILLRFAGFVPIRPSEAPVTAEAFATLAKAAKGPAVTLFAPDYGRLDLLSGTNLEVIVGEDAMGARLLQIVFRDRNMQNLCLQFTGFCEDHGSPIRRADISVAGGSITISGEAFLDMINAWSEIEIHVMASGDGLLKIASISHRGIRYALPANAFGDRIRQIEATLAAIVNQLQVESSDGVFSFAGFDLRDNRLVASFR